MSIAFGLIVTPIFFFAEAIFLAIGQEPDVARQGHLAQALSRGGVDRIGECWNSRGCADLARAADMG